MASIVVPNPFTGLLIAILYAGLEEWHWALRKGTF